MAKFKPGSSFRDFQKNKSRGSSRGSKGDRKGRESDRFAKRGFDRGPKMHRAVCGECGDKCEVPFKPTGKEPVKCRRCFQKTGPANTEQKSQLKEINEKLDKIMKVLQIE